MCVCVCVCVCLFVKKLLTERIGEGQRGGEKKRAKDGLVERGLEKCLKEKVEIRDRMRDERERTRIQREAD